jgi:hypothetical protein
MYFESILKVCDIDIFWQTESIDLYMNNFENDVSRKSLYLLSKQGLIKRTTNFLMQHSRKMNQPNEI